MHTAPPMPLWAWQQPFHGGRELYVCNRTGVRAGDGKTRKAPLSTIAEALNRAANTGYAGIGTGHTGDETRIHVLPGHVESVDAADWASELASSNVKLIGHQYPVLNWTAAGSTFLLDQPGFEVVGFELNLAGSPAATTALSVAAPIAVSAARCAFRYNRINAGVDTNQKVTGFCITTVDAADWFAFEDNVVWQGIYTAAGAFTADTNCALAAAKSFLNLVGADFARICRNHITVANTTVTDGIIEGTTTASKNIVIDDNFLESALATSTCAIDFGTDLAHTGVMRRNLMRVRADGTTQAVVYTRHANVQIALGTDGNANHLINDLGERGLIIGVASV